KLPLADVLAPAIFYAERGFPVSDIIAARWADQAPKLAADRAATQTYLPNGRAPRAGEIFTNRDLASALARIARDRRNGFYSGDVADAILSLSAAHDGTMTLDDLRQFEPEWVAPIQSTYRGWNVYELPPNTQGIAALMMLDLMEQFPL